jgi:hypothetical protein
VSTGLASCPRVVAYEAAGVGLFKAVHLSKRLANELEKRLASPDHPLPNPMVSLRSQSQLPRTLGPFSAAPCIPHGVAPSSHTTHQSETGSIGFAGVADRTVKR